MSRRLRYLGSAQNDIRGIVRYIATQAGNRDAGSDFGTKLRERCKRIAQLPAILGITRPDISSDLRSTPFQAYVIYFRYHDGDVEIVSVLHASRDAEAHFHG